MAEEKPLPQNYEQVLRLIPLGMARPIPNKEIQSVTGLSERLIRDIVKNLITQYKIPIGAVRGDISGYFIPTDTEERFLGLVELDKQVREEQKRIEILMYADLKEHEKYLKEDSNV